MNEWMVSDKNVKAASPLVMQKPFSGGSHPEDCFPQDIVIIGGERFLPSAMPSTQPSVFTYLTPNLPKGTFFKYFKHKRGKIPSTIQTKNFFSGYWSPERFNFYYTHIPLATPLSLLSLGKSVWKVPLSPKITSLGSIKLLQLLGWLLCFSRFFFALSPAGSISLSQSYYRGTGLYVFGSTPPFVVFPYRQVPREGKASIVLLY